MLHVPCIVGRVVPPRPLTNPTLYNSTLRSAMVEWRHHLGKTSLWSSGKVMCGDVILAELISFEWISLIRLSSGRVPTVFQYCWSYVSTNRHRRIHIESEKQAGTQADIFGLRVNADMRMRMLNVRCTWNTVSVRVIVDCRVRYMVRIRLR